MDPPAHVGTDETTTYYHESADFYRIARTVHEVNQTPAPQIQVITHLSVRLHTEVDPPALMLVVSQVGSSHYPLIALYRVDLSTLDMDERARAFAHTVIHAIYTGDIARPSVLMAETEQLTSLINISFFEVGCWLEARLASPGENESVDHKWRQLMRDEKAAGQNSYGRMLVAWQAWNQGSD